MELAPMSEWTCSRIDPEKPAPEPCPDELMYVWKYFQSMNRRRGSSGFGLSPISNLDVEAWARLNHVSLSAFDIEALETIEVLYLNAMQPPKTKAK